MKIKALPLDTNINAKKAQIIAIRNMSVSRRAELFFEMNENQRQILAAGVRQRHPDYSDQDVNLAVIRLMLGDDLFVKIYPDTRIRT